MKKWFVWPVLLAGVLCACGAQPTGQSAVTLPMNTERPVVADLPADEAGPTPKPTPAAETTLTAADLTLEEKVGQLFIIRPDSLDLTLPQEQIDDAKADGVTELTDAMRDALQKYPVGGVCQFGKNIVDPEQITAFNAALQEASDIPLFISVDEEGGAVARLANKDTFDLPRYESAAAVGAEGADAACAMGQTIGGYLRTYGFNMDFAPDADVNTNPDNPIIGTRAFSSDAAEAADCAAAMARGLAGEGILPTFKHFPGHGDTAEDSHTGLAYSYRTVEELTACELLPFEAAAEVGPRAVMVGHIVVPELTGDLPATLCADAIALMPDAENTLIVTDSLAMGAITDSYTPGEAAVQALQAGCDVLLMPDGLADAYDAVLAAVQNGTLSEDRLDRSVNKILRMKAQFCA
ncbi:glycoside hydrolase family 3 N-terminal domain-containing protein [Gemmiger sp.]|uniref:glycoside hydrolase family 3 N-terminal domain-containing protein n=1 Tax=Gemmiger sp. TaxID=2049027 RepID=UPI00307C18D9